MAPDHQSPPSPRGAHPRLRLIDDWRRAHRLLSIWVSALSAAIMAAWTSLPDDIRAALPEVEKLAALLFALAVLARLTTTRPRGDA